MEVIKTTDIITNPLFPKNDYLIESIGQEKRDSTRGNNLTTSIPSIELCATFAFDTTKATKALEFCKTVCRSLTPSLKYSDLKVDSKDNWYYSGSRYDENWFEPITEIVSDSDSDNSYRYGMYD